MTDAEIIKGLKCCSERNLLNDTCPNCPYSNRVYPELKGCSSVLAGDLIKLIKRQQAECNQLGKRYIEERERVRRVVKRFYLFGAKKFADRLKNYLELTDCDDWFEITEHGLICEINEVLKEMVGDSNV